MKALLLAAALAGSLHAAEPAGPDPRWAGLLEKLVSINSSTDNSAGLEKCAALLTPEFERLGFEATIRRLSNGHQVLSFEKRGAKPEILLLGHLDTVFKASSPFASLRKEDGRWTGPGVIDMKGGLVMMLNALDRLGDPALLGRLRIVVNDDEETGSSFSKDALRELARGMPVVLVFEPGAPDGSVVGSASGIRWIRITVEGAAAHAGMDHQKGLNACVELAAKSVELSKLTDYSRNLTVNVGTLEGGEKPNVVCPRASAVVDLRFVDPADLAAALKSVEAIRGRVYAGNPAAAAVFKSSIQVVAEMPSLPPSAADALARLVGRLSAAQGAPVRAVHVGYGSDGNHLAEAGRRILVGLGPYGGGMHTEQEYMDLAGYRRRLDLNVELIRSLLTQKETAAHE